MSFSTPPDQPLNFHCSTQAIEFPPFAWLVLEQDQVKSNVVLPILAKCRDREQSGIPTQGHLWIVVYTPHGRVRLIASCTDGSIGRYPIFLFTPDSYANLHPNRIVPALRIIALQLRNRVGTRRVYSVFGPQIVTATFSKIWTSMTNISQVDRPYYHAKISYITRQTFQEASTRFADHGEVIRPANEQDIPQITELCYGFSIDSPPFELTMDNAEVEATLLVRNHQVWVLTVPTSRGITRVATIVAFTRNTEFAATITKVFTPFRFRGARRAEKLVRAVCRYLLGSRQRVSLFVGVENRAANVYRRVGFVGLEPPEENAPPVEGVDPWIELGFDRNCVDLGHW